MTARDMRFQADLSDTASKKMDGLIEKVKAVSKQVKTEEEKQTAAAEKEAKRREAIANREATQRIALQRSSVSTEEKMQQERVSSFDKLEKQRIALQRSSISLMEKQRLDAEKSAAANQTKDSVKALRETKTQAEAVKRIETQAALAQASLVSDRFDRRIAVEKAKHAIIMQNLRTNDAAQEAEIRRHMATVSRIEMDKANLPSTPFQKLLGILRSGSQAQAVPGASAMSGGAQALAGGSKISAMAGEVGTMVGPMLAGAVAIGTLTKAIGAAMDASQRMTTIMQTLNYVGGSAEGGAKQFKYLYEESMRLGLSIKDIAPDFALFSVAAKGTKLEGEGVRKLFTGLSEAATVMHLPAEKSAAALNAFQQMLSKGKMQSQEVVLQLGNAMPGALQMFARSMGKTTPQFLKMMELGKFSGDAVADAISKMGDEMHKTFGPDAVKASDNARQSITKFNNEMFIAASTVGNLFVEAAGKAAKAFLYLTGVTDKAMMDVAKSGRNQLNNVERVQKDIELAEIGAIRARFMHGRKTTIQEMGAMNKAIAEYQKKAAADAQVKPVKSKKKDSPEQIAHQIELEDEMQLARAAAARDGEAKAVAQEKIRYEKEKRHLLGSPKEIEDLEKIHTDKLIGIRLQYTRKSDMELTALNEKKQEELIKNSKRMMDWTKKDIAERQQADENELNIQAQNISVEKMLRDNRNAAMKDGNAKVAAETYAARKDEMDHVQEMEDRKTISAEEAEQLRTGITKKYSNQRKLIQKAETMAIASATAGLLGNIGQLMGVMAGKNRAMAKAGMRLAEGEAIINTAVGITKAFRDGGFLGFLTGASIAAAGAVQVGNIEKQLNRFATGTDYAPGGMALVGENGPEMVHIPKGSRVDTAPKTAQMMGSRMQNNITIQLSAGVTQSDANMVADAVANRLDILANDLEELQYRRVRRGYRSAA